MSTTPTDPSWKFQPGRLIVTTRGAANALGHHVIAQALSRHFSGDWGEMCEEDKKENDAALETGQSSLLSVFKEGSVEFWIKTEWDRSVTTVYLPEED